MTDVDESNELEAQTTASLGARCRGCGYSIELLPESRCPECFTEFDLHDPTTFVLAERRTDGAVPWLLLCLCIGASALSVVSRGRMNRLWLLGSLLQAAVVVVASWRVRRSRSVVAVLYWISISIAVVTGLYSWAVPRLH